MGFGKFYTYDGFVRTLACPLQNEIFHDITASQLYQTTCGTNESFDEVWWFYCSTSATTPDKYVIYNYTTQVWVYGTMTRTAWLDSPLRKGPVAATSLQNLVEHEVGLDDVSTGSSVGISAYIESATFDIGDGNSLGYINRILPDVTFDGSTASSPSLTLTARTQAYPGAAHNSEVANAVTRVSTVDVEQWTTQVYIRARGRVMSLKVASSGVGVHWKLGVPRIDVRPDGRAS